MKKITILVTLIIILSILDCYLFFNFIFVRFRNENSIQKYDVALANELYNSNFEIEKITIYSSASGINKNQNFQDINWILDIFQYSDIAIYFKKPKSMNSDYTAESLIISNVKLNVASNRYTPSLYYLDANNFGTDKILADYKIENNLEYTVLNFDNKDNSIKYNTPVFFSDLSNPITLKFTNTLLTNYSIPNTEKLIFDGSLLSKANIKSKDLKATISFDITITNFEKEKYSTNLTLEIPIQNENIFNGKILETKNINLPLLKVP